MNVSLASVARFVLLGVFALTASAGSGCSPPPKGELERETGPRASSTTFRTAGVATVFEKRCGTLDCHGDPARNLRIYSGQGLRLPNDAGLAVGKGDTTQDEVLASYQSILTLEPELTNKVLEGGDPYQLLVLKKPLGLEKHKGGTMIRRGDDAERCIVSWLEEGPSKLVEQDACARAALFPKE
jgi:hypothetical protein